MARHVYDNAMVAHVWAQGTQESGRSHNGQFYFEGERLYSYGSHFLVGLILDSGEVLLNASRYGLSTSKHQSYASSATRHRLCFRVPELTLFVRDVMTRPDAVRKFVAERILGMGMDVAVFLLRAFAGVKKPAATVDRMIRDANKAIERKKVEAAKRDREDRLRDATKLAGMTSGQVAEWYAGLENRPGYLFDNLNRTLRKALKAQIEAKKAGRVRQVAKISALRKQIKGYLAIETARTERKDSNHRVHANIRSFRHYVKKHNEGALSAGRYDAMADAAMVVSEYTGWMPVATVNRLRATATEARNRAESMRAEEAARRFAAETLARQSWLNGTPGYWRGTDERGCALLRVRRAPMSIDYVGDVLETSQGASVPLAHAVKAFKAIKRCRDHGVSWKRNGETIRVGHFQIDAIEPTGDFVAGCHRIGWNEVERIARQLNLFAGD